MEQDIHDRMLYGITDKSESIDELLEHAYQNAKNYIENNREELAKTKKFKINLELREDSGYTPF